MHIQEEKAILRQRIKERMSHIGSDERAAESRSLCRRILETLPPGPITVCAYYPLVDEVDVRPLIKELLKRGDRVFLPRFEGRLVFRRMNDMEDLQPGEWKIPEPQNDADELDSATLDIALVPGRAYTKKGERLGRGNGGYDIWITTQRAANPQTKFWGVALESQIVDSVPMEAHDATVDAIVTARGTIVP